MLSRAGSDVSGNLILGNPAYEQWQGSKVAPIAPLKARGLGAAYARLAERAIAAGVPGSSAAGEFPKFPALRELDASDTPHVLVKFSGADGSPAVRRWADLLVCEHLALDCAAALPGVESARSRIVVHAGRTFLEVERFDRHGLFGRSRLISLSTLDAALLGVGSTDWTRLASRLAAAGLLGADDVERVDHLWWFGRLIVSARQTHLECVARWQDGVHQATGGHHGNPSAPGGAITLNSSPESCPSAPSPGPRWRVAMAHGLNANLVHKWRRRAAPTSGRGPRARAGRVHPAGVAKPTPGGRRHPHRIAPRARSLR